MDIATLIPSALAVLRFMMRSSFTACWTRKLAGFSPLPDKPEVATRRKIPQYRGVVEKLAKAVTCRFDVTIGTPLVRYFDVGLYPPFVSLTN